MCARKTIICGVFVLNLNPYSSYNENYIHSLKHHALITIITMSFYYKLFLCLYIYERYPLIYNSISVLIFDHHHLPMEEWIFKYLFIHINDCFILHDLLFSCEYLTTFATTFESFLEEVFIKKFWSNFAWISRWMIM